MCVLRHIPWNSVKLFWATENIGQLSPSFVHNIPLIFIGMACYEEVSVAKYGIFHQQF